MWLLFFFFKMMAWKDTQMFSSNLFTESAASDKMHLVISLLIFVFCFQNAHVENASVSRVCYTPCVIQHSVAHSHDNAFKIRKLALRERGSGISPKSQISLVEGNLAEVISKAKVNMAFCHSIYFTDYVFYTNQSSSEIQNSHMHIHVERGKVRDRSGERESL